MKVRRVDYYPDEYIVGVSRLTFEQQGLYWMVCSLIVSHGGPIPADAKWIGSLGGMGPAKCRSALAALIQAGKLIENDGKIGQERAENELKHAQKRIETAEKNGKKGGRPSKEINDIAKPGGFSDEKLTTNYQLPTTNQHESDTDSEPDLLPDESDTNMPTPPAGGTGELFDNVVCIDGANPRAKPTKADLTKVFNDRFWPLYPRKVGKPKALEAFLSKAKKSTARAIVIGLRTHAAAWEEAGIAGKFIPHPTTWLNQERYAEAPDVQEPEQSGDRARRGATGPSRSAVGRTIDDLLDEEAAWLREQAAKRQASARGAQQ